MVPLYLCRYDAFHFAHIVILFVGFVFLLQSGLLSGLVRYRNRALLSHDNSSSEELIIEYVNLHNKGGIMKYLFDFGPIELREKIEYKIIQEFFVRNYNLPPEFKFANYMCGVLRHYVISLVEVRPISWVILACFVCLNLFRIEVIDHIYARSVCERYPAKNLHLSSAHRSLTQLFAGTDDVDNAADLAYGKHVCQEYLLRYTFVLLFFIMFYVIGVLVASEVYIQRLIGKVLDQEETIEWLEDEEQRNQQMAMLGPQQGDLGADADAEGYVDIHHLPDDTRFEASNPQRSASKDSAEAKYGEGDNRDGIELTKLRVPHRNSKDGTDMPPAPGTPISISSAPAVLPSAPVMQTGGHGPPPVLPRRMSAAFRQPSGRVRTGSAADVPDELVDQLPPVPVYGAANVRRLSMLHRRNSAKGDDLAAMLDQQHDHAQNNATSPRRLSSGNKGPLSLDLPSNTHAPPPMHRQISGHRAGPSAGIAEQHETTSGGANNSPMRRRLASHHRMGSLRSEISQIEAESGVPGAQRRRMHAGYRQGSLRSEVSDKLSSKNAEAKGTKLLSAHNRRFLYLRCLERIMHVEFDFHANEAKRLGQQELASPTNPNTMGSTTAANTYSALNPSSDHQGISRRMVRGNTIHNLNQQSMRDLLHSPGVSERRERANTRHSGGIVRTNSVSSVQDPSSPHNNPNSTANPDLDLLHTDMRSNFRLMKDLRKEMLEEEKNLQIAQSPVPERSQNGHETTHGEGWHFPKLFGGHAYHPPEPSIPPPERRIVSTFSMDEELGGLAVQEMHELELAHGLDYESAELKSNGKPRHKRHRTFSLTFESPASMTASQRSFQERRYDHMSYMGKLCHNLGVWLHHAYEHSRNMLLGHHIGEEEIKPDADIADLQEDFTHIFLFSSAELYYFCVEFSLLAQCVYLAIWATNLVFIANDSYYPVLWNIALLVPVPLNFLFTKQIIFTSVMLKSIVTLDKYVADKICEEAVDERNVKQRVRKVIRTALRTLEIPRENWLMFTMDQFDLYIPDNDVGLNLSNLKLFLHSMQIFLTDATTKRIFTVLDFDKDDRILWDELMPIVFPELVRKQVKLNRQRNKGSKEDRSSSAQRRATMSFDYQIEGELVTAEEKKEVQKRTRRQKRASMVTNNGADSGTEGIPTADKQDKNGSKSHKKRDKKRNSRGSRSGDDRSSEGSVHKTKIITAGEAVERFFACATQVGYSYPCNLHSVRNLRLGIACLTSLAFAWTRLQQQLIQ